MTLSLGWLDHDAEARDRTNRILGLFQERETRDELGIGQIRDALSDRLFPGTSTIQPRLRYFLFIPWIYRELENRSIRPPDVPSIARAKEIELVEPLLDGSDGNGVFGRVAGGSIQRLPSSVYWSGLRSWQILRRDWSQTEYHFRLPGLKTARLDAGRQRREQARYFEDESPDNLETWHLAIPDPPEEFPEITSFQLTFAEAEYIQDRIRLTHPDSLLAWLSGVEYVPDIEYPWLHPQLSDATPVNRNLVQHARVFSAISHGASRLYNLLLAQEAQSDEFVEEHSAGFREWSEGPDPLLAANWDLNEFWNELSSSFAVISVPARNFIESWVSLVRNGVAKIVRDPAAHDLVRQRERQLKGSRSRFVNRSALDQWGGRAGLTRLSYRWPVVRTLLEDLHDGLTVGRQ